MVATGTVSELGRITTLLSAVEPPTTPLLRQMDAFARQLTIAILALAARRSRRRAGARLSRRGRVPRGRGDGGRRDSRGPAGGDDDHARHRRGTHGRAPRDHPALAGGRDARLGLGDLHRQDRHAHPQRDDGAVRGGCGPHLRCGGRGYSRAAPSATKETSPIPPKTTGCCGSPRWPSCATTRACARTARPGSPTRSDGGRAPHLRGQGGSRPEHLRRELPRTDEIPFDAQHRYMATLHHSHAGRRSCA